MRQECHRWVSKQLLPDQHAHTHTHTQRSVEKFPKFNGKLESRKKKIQAALRPNNWLLHTHCVRSKLKPLLPIHCCVPKIWHRQKFQSENCLLLGVGGSSLLTSKLLASIVALLVAYWVLEPLGVALGIWSSSTQTAAWRQSCLFVVAHSKAHPHVSPRIHAQIISCMFCVWLA